MKLVCNKLQSRECQNKGWVLDGFLNTKDDADYMKSLGLVPNRLFWLDVDKTTCFTRLTNRRFDPADGKVYNLVDSSTYSKLARNPQDNEENVMKRMQASAGLKDQLESVYGYKLDTESPGIMQDVSAFGLGEGPLGAKDKEKMFELVLGNLLKPVPVAARVAIMQK